MRKITLIKTLLFSFCIAFGGHAFGQAVFTSAASGNWNDAGSWTLSSGSDEDGIPDANDNVTIGSAHTITISASTTVECNNLTVAGGSATSITMAGANSIVNIYGSLAATAAPTAGNYIDCTADATAKAVFKRSTNGDLITGTWGTFGEKVRVEIDLPSNVTGSVTVAVKFRELIVKSGTFSTTGEIRPDEGSVNTGKVTVENGATLVTTSIFRRTGTGNPPFASLTINGNGKLIFNGTTANSLPVVASGFPVYSFSSGAQIEYQGGGQTIGDISYPNLIINATTAGTAKTWSPAANRTATSITVNQGILAFGNGVVCTVSGNISVAANGTISASSSANRFQASGSGRTFTLNGQARVTANETQTAAATSPFSYQYNNFATYTFGSNSWVSFRSPTTTAVTQGIDGIAGSPFGNVEIFQNQAVNNIWTVKTNLNIVGVLAFPRTGTGTTTVNFGSFTTKVGEAIQLNGSNTSTQSGGRTYNMGTSTIELNGTAAQTTLGGTDLPGTFNNLTISNSHTSGVTVNNAITVNGTTTINEGAMLSMGATLTANGAVNVNGTFRLNSSGWATGSGAWTYGENGTLAFNSTYGVNSDHVYWPSINGPANVSVLTGVLTLNSGANKTVSGLFQTAGGVALSSATLTLNGTAQINSGGYFSNAPVYGANSTLKYNTGGVYGRSAEWNNPSNVQLSNNTTLNYPNTGGGAFSTNLSIPGNLTVDAGSALYMDYGGGGNKSGRLTVGGNISIAGNLSLGNAVGGDLYIGGNWNKTGGTFSPNGREVRFNGSSNQSINNSSGESFAFLTIANTAGSVVTLNDNINVSNNMSINAASAASNASGKTLEVTGDFTINSSELGTGTFKNNGTFTVNGTSKVQQYLTNQSWYLSSPMAGTVTPTNLSRIQGYNEGVGSGNDWSVSGTTMQSGKGYITSVSAAPNTIEFTGTINSGDISIPLTRQAATDANKYGFNLIGNPYTAYLDWTAVAAANVSKMPTSTMWYRTKVSGSWAFSTVNGSGVTSPANVSAMIPPMQAFWVRASTVGNSNLELTSNMVNHDNNSSNKLKAPAISDRQLIRIQVSNNINTDELVIYTDALAANTFDVFDSPKMSNESADIPEISTIINGQSLVINGMNSLTLDTEIPIRFMTKTANTFKLKANQISNLPEGTKVILSDFGNEFDLTSGDEYHFSSTITDNTNRFNLIFRAPGTTTNITKVNDNRILAYSNNKSITIKLNDNKLIGAEASVYNTLGQKLLSKNISSDTMQFDFTFKPDVYIIKVNNITTKVIVK